MSNTATTSTGSLMRRLMVALVISSAIGCGGSATDPGGDDPTTGSLVLTVDGLPTGVSASVTLTGPAGFSQVVTGTQTLTTLAPGSYSAVAATIAGAQGTWAPGVPTQSITVAAGASAAVTIAYSELLGSLTLTVIGLPGGVDASIEVTGGPSALTLPVTETATLANLRTGTYTVASSVVANGADQYDPDATNASVDVVASGIATVDVTYALRVVVPNTPPVADAGGPYVGTVGGPAVALDGSGSSDSDGTVSVYDWAFAPGGATLSGSTPTFECSVVQGYDVTLTVTDDDGATHAVATTLTCNPAADLRAIGRWVDGTGTPISVVNSGGTAYLQICSAYAGVTALSADVVVDPAAATPGVATGLDSGGAGVHPDCAGTTDVLASFTSTPGGAGTLGITTSGPGTGTGLQGIAAIPYTAGSGTITPSISNIVAADIGGSITFAVDVESLIVQAFSFAEIRLGSLTTCGLDGGGVAYCWGQSGENLGVGTLDAFVTQPAAVIPDDVTGFTALGTGQGFSCALDAGGAAWCWGYSATGQGGNGSQNSTVRPTAVSGGLLYKELSVGLNHTCAIDTLNATYCWGRNLNGWLGTGGPPSQLTPALVVGGPQFDQISSGFNHTCALAGGQAWCWGEDFGTTPVQVPGGFSFVQITAGARFTCGLEADGDAYCWGLNNGYQFGDGTTVDSGTPVAVAGGPFSQISAGTFHACGVTTIGDAYCWGFGAGVRIGDGQSGNFAETPSQVAGGHDFEMIAAGDKHTCGLTSTGQALCWGGNAAGENGDGTFDPRSTPVAVLPPN